VNAVASLQYAEVKPSLSIKVPVSYDWLGVVAVTILSQHCQPTGSDCNAAFHQHFLKSSR